MLCTPLGRGEQDQKSNIYSHLVRITKRMCRVFLQQKKKLAYEYMGCPHKGRTWQSQPTILLLSLEERDEQ